jgi:general secretion pathway protein I
MDLCAHADRRGCQRNDAAVLMLRLVPKQLTGGRQGRCGCSRSAFTLLEVLVALAIFAMAAIALAGAYVNILIAYDIAGKANEANADVAFARSIVLNEPDRKKLEEGGEFDTADNGHIRWSVEIASTNEADLFSVAFTCEVTDPTQQPQHGPEKIVQTFTVLRPTWSIDPAERDKLRQDAKARILELQGKDKK